MTSMKYEIEKFTDVNDFSLWCLKTQVLLVQKDLLEALKGSKKMDVALTEIENTTMMEKTHSAIILSLGDKVLRKVLKEKTTTGV